VPGSPKTCVSVICNSPQRTATRLVSYTRTGHPFLGFSSWETLQFSHQTIFWIPLTQIHPQNLYITLYTSKDNQNNNIHGIITSTFTKIIIMFIFHQHLQFFQFSFKFNKQPHQFKPHQHSNIKKHS